MTTVSAALPVMGYLVGSIFVAYIAIRAYRYVKQRNDKSAALPRPVYETAQKKSPFSFVKPIGRDWNLPMPWPRSPAKVALPNRLSVELLPTTALPPPPTSIPTIPPLVDLSTPSALEASSGSCFSISLPSSPKRHSRPLLQRPSTPQSHKSFRSPQHPALPHALLATTPPQRHSRSRSLGGVPVRRLSGEQSGLRNKVHDESQHISPGHVRWSSKERLLIDFSSPSDHQASGLKHHPATISPAASDIGISPPSAVDDKTVEPGPMPLVDVGDDILISTNSDPDTDNTAWMWFNFNAPSSIRSYDARILAPRPQVNPFSGERKFAFPLSFPKTEKLIDVPFSEDTCMELDSLDSSTTLVETAGDVLETKNQIYPVVLQKSVDGISQGINMDPFSDDHAADYSYGSQTQANVNKEHDPPIIDVVDTHVDVKAPADAGLTSPEFKMGSPAKAGEDAPWISVGVCLPSISTPPTLSPASAVVPYPSPATDPSSQPEELGDWWIETDDPWNDHFPIQDVPSDKTVEICLSPTHQDGSRHIESSLGGSLLATLLHGEAGDDEVPHLSLDDPEPTELRISHAVQGQPSEEDEEDTTPKPTPVSFAIQLPGSDDGVSLRAGKTGVIALDIEPLEQAIVDHPDPDLLPLPIFNLPPATVLPASNKDSTGDPVKIELHPLSQTPTPPASPPPPTLRHQRNMGKPFPSPKTEPTNLKFTEVMRNRSRSSSPRALRIALPAVASAENHTVQDVPAPDPTSVGSESMSPGQAKQDVEEISEKAEEEGEIEGLPISLTSDTEDETSLPGSLPEVPSMVASPQTMQTMAASLTEKSRPAIFHPSVRAIIRQPVEIALAMQLRPGLGAGADPAWMVRFLMAMFGWFAVLVSGQENF